MFKIVNPGNLDYATRKADEITDRGLRQKLDTIFTAFLTEISSTAPVNTGEFLASFRVSDATRGESAGPQGPKARPARDKYLPEVEAMNRQRAIDRIFEEYAETRRELMENPRRRFYIINNAAHAASLEYGGSRDFTSGAHRGIIAAALQKALVAAKARKR